MKSYTQENREFFIWTEVFNCSEIGIKAIETFFKYHKDLKLHVYGFMEDLNKIPNLKNLVKVNFDKEASIFSKKLSEKKLKKGFSKGHLGTALLWREIILNTQHNHLIHFDSDIIFQGNIIEDLITYSEKYDLVGPTRPYKYNQNNYSTSLKLPDICQTCCFYFNKSKISKRKRRSFLKMVLGSYNPYGFQVIDFFDPVMFDIYFNGGKIFNLSFDIVGGVNSLASRDNKYKEINNFDTDFKIDYGEKMIHFSAVGSGLNFFKNINKINVPKSYVDYAIDRYALYSKVYLNKDIGIDLTKYDRLIKMLSN